MSEATLRHLVETAIGIPLSDADRFLLALRLGWGLEDPATQLTVARMMGCSGSTVAKRERNLSDRLRKSLADRG